jgi:hypothetical protein
VDQEHPARITGWNAERGKRSPSGDVGNHQHPQQAFADTLIPDQQAYCRARQPVGR